MGVVLLLIILWSAVTVSELYGPTEDEWQFALSQSKPRSNWGYQARTDRNLRLFILGGSNTMWDTYWSPLQSYLTLNTTHPTWKGSALRRGISGITIAHVVGMKFYEFERLPVEQWPNVIMFEFAANLISEHFATAQRSLDALVNGFNLRYQLVGLPPPDYMFFELMNVRYYVQQKDKKASSALDVLNQDIDPSFYQKWHGRNRGCSGCHYIRDFAGFYGYPTVSWRDAGYSAFVRYYVGSTTKTYQEARWNYTRDGQHISKLAGSEIVTHLLGPFFDMIMTPRTEHPESGRTNYGNLSLQLTPPALNTFQIELYATWTEEHNGALEAVIKKPMQWTRMNKRGFKKEPDEFLQRACYGSFDQDATLEIEFTTPSACNDNECRTNVQFLHSWNTSQIGSVRCSLYHGQKVLVKDMLINGTLDSQGNLMTITANQKVGFNATLLEGKHEIVCKKMDSKLSCIEAFDVSAAILL